MNDPFAAPLSTTTPYPLPPWRLWGSALVASFIVRAETAAALVPDPLTLVRLPGDLATGYVAAWRYVPGSTLEYNELVAGVLARYGNRFGFYVTHIGVDSERSQRAGRDLWYLPKQFWQFDWQLDQPETSLHVWEGARLVCAMNHVPVQTRLWPLQISLNFFTLRGRDVAIIPGTFDVRIANLPWRLQFGPDSPLAPLQPVGPAFLTVTLALKGMVEVEALQVLDAEP